MSIIINIIYYTIDIGKAYYRFFSTFKQRPTSKITEFAIKLLYNNICEPLSLIFTVIFKRKLTKRKTMITHAGIGTSSLGLAHICCLRFARA